MTLTRHPKKRRKDADDESMRSQRQATFNEIDHRLRELEALTNVGHWVWFPLTNEVYWSEETFRIFGRDPSSFHPDHQCFDAAILPDDRAAFFAESERSLRERDDMRIAHRIVRPDGTIRQVLALAVIARNGDGKVVQVRGTLQDITEQQEMQQTLRAQQQALERRASERTSEIECLNQIAMTMFRQLPLSERAPAVLKTIVDGTGADLAALFVRDAGAMCFVASSTRDGLRAPSPTDCQTLRKCLCALAAKGERIYATDLATDLRRDCRHCLDAGMRSIAALPLSVDDSVLAVLCLGARTPVDFPARDSFFSLLTRNLAMGVQNSLLYDGARRYAAELERQIEARRKAEQELLVQRAQALRADRLRSLGEMAAGIAHELNQPLGGIRALAEQTLIAMRRNWTVDPADLRQELQMIVEQADRMSHIINHVRLFARQAGKPELTPTDMNEVIEGSAGMVRAQFQSRGIAIAMELTSPVPAVSVNPFSMEEVFLNLLSNARDAIESLPGNGGTITMRSSTVTSGGRQWVCMEVGDCGPGIPSAVLDRIFDPFFTTKSPDRGTGLGLPIARSIVESFGGSIRVESPPAGGTLVTVLLPVSEGLKGNLP
ncbi:MAG: ATP-binding protein [Kiritimatiellae bacterium]|nr:ATP-binding protein [Kiritimatiellia bacterium]